MTLRVTGARGWIGATLALTGAIMADTVDHTTLARLVEAGAVRSAFEDKAHTGWVREKVAESLADPQPNILHRQVMNEVQALIDSKRKQCASKTASPVARAGSGHRKGGNATNDDRTRRR